MIERMRGWLGAVIDPAGEVPLLNDGYAVDRATLASLRSQPATAQSPASESPANRSPLPRGLTAPTGQPAGVTMHTLPDTGLVIATAGAWHLLADVGAPCPDELPAHAQADTFGCLVHVDGAPLLVDTGTSTYEPGPIRDYQRSTTAHNTAVVDGTDSTEVWGTFRAGRRARVHDVVTRRVPGGLTIEASHDGYRRLPGSPVHRRRWSLTAAGLQVDDQVTGGGEHEIAIRWHLAPGSGAQLCESQAGSETAGAEMSAEPACRPATTAAGAFDTSVATPTGQFDVTITAPGTAKLAVETGPVAAGFQVTTQAPVLTCHVSGSLPIQVSTRWRRASGQPAAARPARHVPAPEESDRDHDA